jgi:ribosomal protein L11 methylase PrmA
MTTRQNSDGRVAGSFRDPNGFVFKQGGVIYRQINQLYAENYAMLMDSGLYERLTGKGWLIPHTECDGSMAQTDAAHKVIRPEPVPFIAYPYEWSFSQLKDAALLTLNITKAALKKGMILKDASAYNIQFINGKPCLIDTLSFEKYEEGQPWIAYRQFCQHFLAPLALAHYKDIRLMDLSRIYIDGIPLDLAASLLPKRSWLRMGIAMHIRLHSRAQSRYDDKPVAARTKSRTLSRKSLLNIIDSLYEVTTNLQWRADTTAWSQYYQGDSYDNAGLDHKKRLVSQYIDRAKPNVVWDLGANTGLFSRIATAQGVQTIAWDIDAGAVELNYRQLKQEKTQNLLPLILDLANPSPALGWANNERASLIERANADMILALALIHHLAISNNVPLNSVAQFMSQLAEWLAIEFVPKSDPKVQTLLASREDIFPDYTRQGFTDAFSAYFEIVESNPIENSDRIHYLMRRKAQE